ncbi:MAG: LysR family transcriptional regulator [Candidatus Protochlamydia sp.]|nr:LysR family transcriptional regulator [Candidatus Protochlamydia sp.]
MIPLKLIYVKYFCDAIKLGSVIAAAKVNFVTQSAISQGIAKLEHSLKISLLAHHPNRFRMTPEGEKLFLEFIEILRNSDEIQSKIVNGKISCLGDLVFSSSYSFAYASLPHYLNQFIADYPQIKIKLSLSYPSTVKDDIRNGKIDFGIIPKEGDIENFNKKIIHSGKFKFYVPKGMQAKDHNDCKFILTEQQSKETIYVKKAYFKKFKKELINLIEVDNWEMIAKLTSLGVGIGYLPDYFVEGKSDLPLKEYPLGIKTEEYQMIAISAKGMKLRKSSEIFLSYFK